ncbi:hypothetical protein [Trueperella sp. LYQ143]|uniref:hypothetical protein n=1 Tax=Trueperella sp. LYQ143 TaxID=3391059 RepID=UPI003983B53D
MPKSSITNKKKTYVGAGLATLLLAGGITGGVAWHVHSNNERVYAEALEGCEGHVKGITAGKDEAKKLSEEYATFLTEYAEYGNENIQKTLDGLNALEIGTCSKDTFDKIGKSATDVNTALESAKKDLATAKAKAIDGKKKALHDQIAMLGEAYNGFVDQATLDGLNKSADELNNLDGVKGLITSVNQAVAGAQGKKDAHDKEVAQQRAAEEAQRVAEAQAQRAQAYSTYSPYSGYSHSGGATTNPQGGGTGYATSGNGNVAGLGSGYDTGGNTGTPDSSDGLSSDVDGLLDFVKSLTPPPDPNRPVFDPFN